MSTPERSKPGSPRGLSVAETMVTLNISHATLYRLLAVGKLNARKCGSRTFVDAASVEAYWNSLPAAAFRGPAKRAA